MRVTLTPRQAEALFRKLPSRVDKQARIAIKEAIRNTGYRDYRALQKVGQEIYYRGEYLEGFEFKQVSNSYNFDSQVLYALKNEAPHAGILEVGTKPLTISSGHRYAIVVWAMEKLGVTEREAVAISVSVAERVKREGYPAKKYIWNQVKTSLARIIRKFLSSFNRRLSQRKMLSR